jgi:hypothetical protein
MNRLLIGVLDILNKLAALLFIVSGALSGYAGQYGYIDATGIPHLQGFVGAVIGLIGGLIVAGLVSGFLAAVITISRELTLIRELIAARSAPV